MYYLLLYKHIRLYLYVSCDLILGLFLAVLTPTKVLGVYGVITMFAGQVYLGGKL